MSSDNVFESVKSILVDQLNISEDSVQMDSLFVDDLNADSLDMVELVMAMEQEFNISIPDEEAERIKTVGDAVEFIKSKM
ncbi:MAG: acyl carrier protein [Clostridiales bacterium]|jgi:acyl carrier protein|nr:acyl carrier protein [Clostridiales bacterium]MEE3351126.1 acyl carrier protein [Saccharofermentanaceae bacterium]MBQ4185293.1 acyl carrier protein [Clostridiales bacterium]MBR3033288.1 acyl carrier protein [Clostridiales bacterium]MCR5274840.1 acyl carrier protein [Clostridiales bacterium]